MLDTRNLDFQATDTVRQQRSVQFAQKDKVFETVNTDMVRRQSSVRFAKNDEVFEIPSREEYSEQEIRACYISTSEERNMLTQQFKVIRKMEQGTAKKSSYRGLESHTDKGNQAMERRRLRCIDLVMDEQDIQMEKDIYDSEKLCNISMKTSKKSKKLTLKQAKKDAVVARKYLRLHESVRNPICEDGIKYMKHA